MRSKILVRILIVLLAAFLIFRIHQRVETYRVPRELCRSQITVLAQANVQHMFEKEGVPAPDLDSLLIYAKDNGYFSTTMTSDSIKVELNDGQIREVLIPQEWKDLWNETAIEHIQSALSSKQQELTDIQSTISLKEQDLGFSLDSLISIREVYVENHPGDTTEVDGQEVVIQSGTLFDDSLGYSAQDLLDSQSAAAASIDSLQGLLQHFNDIVVPARQDSVSRTVVAVCPTLWENGYYDSVYSYDPKLALGTQFSLSCPNIDRHGGIVGGFVQKDYPDTVFMEPDWAENQIVYAFPEYAAARRLQASRANLIRAAEEEAAYLAQRYPMVIVPKDPEMLEMNIDELIDPLGGEYVFELQPDTSYVFYENPDGRTRRARGDSVVINTEKFVAYTTADPDTSRVEVFFSHPMTFPSRLQGAGPGDNDHVTLIKYWDRSEFGSLRIDEREVDLLDDSTWDILSTHFGHTDSTETE